MYRVMIVEDEVFVRQAYKAIVRWQELHMEVVADVANGQEAMDAYERLRPDIIMTDLRMPVMDGMELIRRIRRTDQRTRFLIITCLEEFDKVRAAMELGVSGYVLKLETDAADLEAKLDSIRRELDAFPDRHEWANGALPPKVKDALRFIEQRYVEEISLSDVSAYIGVTPNYLSRLFAKYLHKSYTSILNDVRIREARRLLQSTDLSVHQVGRQVGYMSDTYFIRVFKNRMGMTPHDYGAARAHGGGPTP